MRYDTPDIVASLLRKYAPKKMSSLLDPATGSGVLIRPFLKTNPKLRAICIDVDKVATAFVADEFKDYRHVKVFTDDFLRWAGKDAGKQFDCIVMNPPFAARKQHRVKILVPVCGEKKRATFVSSESAFVYAALTMLRVGGRLLAIVPASIVSTESGLWLRKMLLKSGAVRLVHELPPRTFAGVDGKIFVLIYEHGAKQRAISIRNHRLREPDEIALSRSMIIENPRFDFAFHESIIWYRKLRSLSGFAWKTFGSVADCWRGEIDSPFTSDDVLHTTNFSTFRPSRESKDGWLKPVRRGDLIVKRVGRDCAKSWLPYLHKNEAPCSDCIFVVRPKPHIHSLNLLFALRVLTSSQKGAPLIEHGVGAAYLTRNSLQSLMLPIDLASKYPKSFDRFRTAVRGRQWTELAIIEARVRRQLQRRCES
jgi:hypothetical protein